MVAFALMGCSSKDVTGPVPTAKLSTEKVSYERGPEPALPRFDLGDLSISDDPNAVLANIPSVFKRNERIIVAGRIRRPEHLGKIVIVYIDFTAFIPKIGREATLNQGLSPVKDTDGLVPFEIEVRTPVTHEGKCKVRLWAETLQKDIEEDPVTLPKSEFVTIGSSETFMRTD